MPFLRFTISGNVPLPLIRGDFILWGWRSGQTGTYTSTLILDPQGKFEVGQPGIHMAAALWTHAHNFNTVGGRNVRLMDLTLTVGGVSTGPFPAWGGNSGRSRVCFGTDHLYLVSNNTFYTVTVMATRISELITRVNQLITRLNSGWVVSATGTTSSYSGSGLTTMGTSLTV